MLDNRTMDNLAFDGSEQKPKPRYDLSREELMALEDELVKRVEKNFSEEGVYAVLMSPESKYANVLRTYEAGYFPEVQDLDSQTEEDTIFLAMVDTRLESRRLVHATTLSAMNQEAKESVEPTTTGFYTVDDLIDMGNFTAKEFIEYYEAKGVDLSAALSIDTNFKVGEKAPKYNGMDTVQLAYLSIFSMIQRKATRTDLSGERKRAAFASINLASIISFKRMGIECEPLMGREDLVTSESERGLKYTPVAIVSSESTLEMFEAAGLAVPEMALD